MRQYPDCLSLFLRRLADCCLLDWTRLAVSSLHAKLSSASHLMDRPESGIYLLIQLWARNKTNVSKNINLSLQSSKDSTDLSCNHQVGNYWKNSHIHFSFNAILTVWRASLLVDLSCCRWCNCYDKALLLRVSTLIRPFLTHAEAKRHLDARLELCVKRFRLFQNADITLHPWLYKNGRTGVGLDERSLFKKTKYVTDNSTECSSIRIQGRLCLEGAFRISQLRICMSSSCLDIMCTHRLQVKPFSSTLFTKLLVQPARGLHRACNVRTTEL